MAQMFERMHIVPRDSRTQVLAAPVLNSLLPNENVQSQNTIRTIQKALRSEILFSYINDALFPEQQQKPVSSSPIRTL